MLAGFGKLRENLNVYNHDTRSVVVAEDIVPIGELKAHLSEKIRELRDRRRPFVVTQNGKAAAVLMAPGTARLALALLCSGSRIRWPAGRAACA